MREKFDLALNYLSRCSSTQANGRDRTEQLFPVLIQTPDPRCDFQRQTALKLKTPESGARKQNRHTCLAIWAACAVACIDRSRPTGAAGIITSLLFPSLRLSLHKIHKSNPLVSVLFSFLGLFPLAIRVSVGISGCAPGKIVPFFFLNPSSIDPEPSHAIVSFSLDISFPFN